jgi:predicted Rossmann-fold nucleotide-binding protein
MDEFFESLTLIQTEKISRFPVVLFGTDYWKGLMEWIKNTMLAEGNISSEDLDLFVMVDSVDDAVNYIDNFYSKTVLSPNF